jgi:hypothetical protein
LGGRLHDALLAGCEQRTAALSTIRLQTPAYHLYRRRGWRTLGEDIHFPGVATPYRVMGLELATMANEAGRQWTFPRNGGTMDDE